MGHAALVCAVVESVHHREHVHRKRRPGRRKYCATEPHCSPGGTSSDNFQRRVKHALARAGIGPALGGIDFSYNEDREQRYDPSWSLHIYLIKSALSATKTRVIRTVLNLLNCTKRTPKPIMVSPFENKAERRSYVLKNTFRRCIGYTETQINKDGTSRKCRNTSYDRLRSLPK